MKPRISGTTRQYLAEVQLLIGETHAIFIMTWTINIITHLTIGQMFTNGNFDLWDLSCVITLQIRSGSRCGGAKNYKLLKMFRNIFWTHLEPLKSYKIFSRAFYWQLSRNMASQLENEYCCVKHCWVVYEQNSIVNLCQCRWLDRWKGNHC